MPETLPDREALSWFARFPPETGPGRLRRAEALIAAGDIGVGRAMLRRAWIGGDFSPEEERRFLGKHGHALRVGDHDRRLDRLLWDERRDATRRMLGHASEAHRRLAEARLMLMERRRGVDLAILQVPRELRNHPGLIYERARWRRLAGNDAGARQLLLQLSADSDRPGKMWPEQRLQVRAAIRQGSFDEAYAVASRHRQTADGPFIEAEWLSGWLALRFAKRPEGAAEHFRAAYERARYPSGRARAAYWSGRAAKEAGDPKGAAEWMRRAARHPTTYYGQLAGGDLSLVPGFPDGEPGIAAEERDRFEARSAVRAARLLGEAGDLETLRIFVTYLSGGAKTPGQHRLIVRLGLDHGATHISAEAAKRALRQGVPPIAATYPLSFGAVAVARLEDPPYPALLLAVAREERGVNPMPSAPETAGTPSDRPGMANGRTRLPGDTGYDVAFAAARLQELLKTYGGDRVLALAAYRAGPSRIDEWLRIHGDPREGGVDPIDWIESVPDAGTRDHVQRVLAGAAVYRHLLHRSSEPLNARAAALRTAAVR